MKFGFWLEVFALWSLALMVDFQWQPNRARAKVNRWEWSKGFANHRYLVTTWFRCGQLPLLESSYRQRSWAAKHKRSNCAKHRLISRTDILSKLFENSWIKFGVFEDVLQKDKLCVKIVESGLVSAGLPCYWVPIKLSYCQNNLKLNNLWKWNGITNAIFWN